MTVLPHLQEIYLQSCHLTLLKFVQYIPTFGHPIPEDKVAIGQHIPQDKVAIGQPIPEDKVAIQNVDSYYFYYYYHTYQPKRLTIAMPILYHHMKNFDHLLQIFIIFYLF